MLSTNDASGQCGGRPLRNVAVRGPYMNDGSLATLEEVVDFYLSPSIHPLYLSPEGKRVLVEFLKALTDPAVRNQTVAGVVLTTTNRH